MGEETSKGQQVKDLQRRLDVLGERAQQLEQDNSALRSRNMLLEAQKVQWEGEKVKQQNMIHQQITTSNGQNSEYLQENQRLRDELRVLKEKMAG